MKRKVRHKTEKIWNLRPLFFCYSFGMWSTGPRAYFIAHTQFERTKYCHFLSSAHEEWPKKKASDNKNENKQQQHRKRNFMRFIHVANVTNHYSVCFHVICLCVFGHFGFLNKCCMYGGKKTVSWLLCVNDLSAAYIYFAFGLEVLFFLFVCWLGPLLLFDISLNFSWVFGVARC